MNRLVSEGFVILGGPSGHGERGPWTPMELLPVASVEPWTLMFRANPGR
jgi:hypothetical protein